MVALAVLVCLRLGWWQWDRTHDADGTVQNLGYAILWPVFGAAFVYMWFRFLQLELLKDAEDDAELTELAAGEHRDVAETGRTDGSGHGDPSREPGVTRVPGPAASRFEIREAAQTDLTSADVGSQAPQPATDDAGPAEPAEPATGPTDAEPARVVVGVGPVVSVNRPSRGVTVAVSTVGDEMQDQDPELAAYNRALAALAEKDHRRAR